MRKIIVASVLLAIGITITSCCKQPEESSVKEGKIVVYQVFTRLFGNKITTNNPWGTIEENGVGKFADFTDSALDSIKALGITHIWYTGVPHHATVTDYSDYGIEGDDPDVVKGRAGSPYAVKDYYNVNPDLATNPARRLDEFKELVQRTHHHGLKVIIDIVPNHVARHYKGMSNPDGISDLGAGDDTSVEYDVNNNFYYVPGQSFVMYDAKDGYKPLGGEKHPKADGFFDENPAKWTGNGSRNAKPDFYDWYETVKVNYGISPDGIKDFPLLPEGFAEKPFAAHYSFWKDKVVPDSWVKFRDIALYWLEIGVDGFRFDMAEMVPVEFWSYMNSSIKNYNPDAFLLAEVYNPALYRDYIHLGKMDYLYDKVQMYDTLKNIMQGHGSTHNIPAIVSDLSDISSHMLHFLENHDEQRIASPQFASDASKGKPAMVVSAAISTAPMMIYFGQEVGEPAAEDAGFGTNSRTTIFDYFGVPHHQRWMNNGAFDGGQLTEDEKQLRDFYKRLLNFTIGSKALMGEYYDLHTPNSESSEGYNDKLFSFARYCDDEQLVVVTNFSDSNEYQFKLLLPGEFIKILGLEDGNHTLTDVLYGSNVVANVANGEGEISLFIKPLESFIFRLD